MNNQCGAWEGGWGSGEIEMRDKDAGLNRQFTAAATAAAGTFVVCVDNRFSRLEPAISGVDSGASRRHSMVIRGHSMVLRVFELRLFRRLLSLLCDYFSFNDSFDQNIEKQKQRASWFEWVNQNIQILKMKIGKKTIHAWILGSTWSVDIPKTCVPLELKPKTKCNMICNIKLNSTEIKYLQQLHYNVYMSNKRRLNVVFFRFYSGRCCCTIKKLL